MNKYLNKSVIVPWDFSEMSIAALKSTLEMVDSPDKIVVVHVTPYPTTSDPAVIWGTLTEESVTKNLRKSFDEACRAHDLPEGLLFKAVFGDPGSEIADLAKESDAGLVVISSHGRSGLTRMLLGSVAERVVRLSPCPVLVLRKDESEA
ncbi:universal stress protein [Mariniblastus fucicola]|uniref:Universal stress protein n=1 Tax=Mariniblastus fucicola TaxID=980251 RepID=A0A5B9PBE4_9BACT|nr:universal stress protein [Mariniblastus fucicola]QEG20443.1 Putative universal stress protein [Mariniblastus fucicola]